MKFGRFLVQCALAATGMLWIAACGSATPVPAQTGQRAYTTGKGRARTNYLLFLPAGYDPASETRWPLMVFLHGIAKRGDTVADLELLKKDGPPMVVEQQPDFAFIVLSPQCPSDSYWHVELDRVDRLLDEIVETYAVDADRIYLTGLSLGGYGAWHYALREPERFAALVPIAGGYQPDSDEVPEEICTLKDLPIWVFHGAADDVVLPRQSEVLVEALRACPADVRFTLYEGADHDDSWKRAYADPELYEWLLAQSLGD